MLEQHELTRRLAGTALFGALGPDDLALVAQAMQERSFRAGQAIFAQGDIGRELFLVLEGRVRLSIDSVQGRTLAFSHACDGEVFGEIAVLDGGTRSADATALTNVRAATLSQSAMKGLIAAHPTLAQAAISFLCKRLRATSEQLGEIALVKLEKRLARFLLHALAMRGPTTTQGAEPLKLNFSQGELAYLVGASRQTVNSALQVLEKEGAIRLFGTALECNFERLEAVAEAG